MDYKNIYKKWINSSYFDEETKNELLAIKDNDKEIKERFYKNLDFGTGGLRGIIGAGTNRINIYTIRRATLGVANYINDKEIKERFYKNLDFGTGGLRGIIGAGTNRINIYTIRRATLGVANYIINTMGEIGKEKGVVIAYDSRFMSKEFSYEAAKTLAAYGIKAYIFDELRPTPELSFAVRYLGCAMGIVITASHNPKEYNGYKVYGQDGGQVCIEMANDIIAEVNKIEDYSIIKTIDLEEAINNKMVTIIGKNVDDAFIDAVMANDIIAEVNKIEDYSIIKTIDLEEAINNKMVTIIGKNVDDAFIDAVKSQIINQDIINEYGKNLKVIFTPIHGSGNKSIRRVLDEAGFKNVEVVKEQEYPDPNFSTVEYPNPEEKSVFNIAIDMAKESNSDLIIGTDPDCDRVGVVVKNSEGEYIVLNGNQVGSLLVRYVIESLVEKNKLPKNPTIVKTIVTSELGAKIAKHYNVETINTLTGFKFIGEKINIFEKTNEKTFIMGYEESYGYLVGTHARDKDGVVSALLICEMAAFYKSKGLSLYEGMIDTYNKFGFYKEELKSITLKGIEGIEKIKEIMNYFRTSNIKSIGNIKIYKILDYKEGVDDLPKSDVLKFILEDDSWIAVRPSGTEPKIKFYFGTKSDDMNSVDLKLENLISEILSLVESI